MYGSQALREAAEWVLARSPADETEVVLLGTDSQLTRFANNEIHQNVAERNVEVRIRTVLDKRVGVAAANALHPEALEHALQQALDLTRQQPPIPDWPGLPSPEGEPSTVRGFSEETAAATPEDRARQVARVCRPAEEAGVIASGALETATQELAVANSHGVFRYYPATYADFVAVVMSDTGSGYAAGAHRDFSALDVEQLGQEAITKALRSRNPVDIEPGVYDVVLEEYAMSDILWFIGSLGFGARPFVEGQSFVSGRLGERVLGENITLVDDGLDEHALPLPFDFEGVPRQRLTLVERGVAKSVVWDTYWAAKVEGQKSTGHALPAPNPWGPLPLHMHLEAGTTPKAELVRQVERGLWVTRFHYTRTVHPLRVIVTGMTRDGTFLIENGEIVGPVKNLRFTQSYVESLNQVVALSAERRLLRGYAGATLVPAAVIRGFTFTSRTTF